jgi:hypothetical protein
MCATYKPLSNINIDYRTRYFEGRNMESTHPAFYMNKNERNTLILPSIFKIFRSTKSTKMISKITNQPFDQLSINQLMVHRPHQFLLVRYWHRSD